MPIAFHRKHDGTPYLYSAAKNDPNRKIERLYRGCESMSDVDEEVRRELQLPAGENVALALAGYSLKDDGQFVKD